MPFRSAIFPALPLLLMVSAGAGLQAQEAVIPSVAGRPAYEIGKRPVWVDPQVADLEKPHPEAEKSNGKIRAGLFFRLIEYQVNAETQMTWQHFVDEFVNTAGVHDEAEFDIEFDPDYQRLILHSIVVHREGETIDRLHPDHIRVTTAEDELGDGLVDGHVTVLILLPDLRPGDRVEYDYTIEGENPAFSGLFFDEIPLQWESWIQKVRYRLLRSPDRVLFAGNNRASIRPVKRPVTIGDENYVEVIWEAENVPPVFKEDNLPGWYDPFARVSLSELETWEAVAEWGRPFYDFSGEPLESPLQSEIDAIRKAHPDPDPEAQAMAAIRFVQDQIRYLGIENGANAFCPVSPNLTCSRRYGDCKDKTVLLHRMLAELGIDSDPVYVNLNETDLVARLQPSPLAFDHVVLRIRLPDPDGREFWCDCTRKLQGGTADSFFFPAFRRGLSLEDGEGLIELPEPSLESSRIEVTETFRAGKPKSPLTRLEVVTAYYGEQADLMRRYHFSRDPIEVEREYLDYYRENYDDVFSEGPVEVTDDRETNRYTVRERYRFSDPWQPDETDPGWYYFEANLQTIRDAMMQPDHVARKMPFAIPYPRDLRHEVRFHLPGTVEEWEGYFEEENHFVEGPGVEFRREIRHHGKKSILTISSAMKIMEDAVDPADIREYRDRMEDIYDLTSYAIWDVIEDETTRNPDRAEGPEEGGGEKEIGEALTADRRTARAIIGAVVAAGVGGFVFGAVVIVLIFMARKRLGAGRESEEKS